MKIALKSLMIAFALVLSVNVKAQETHLNFLKQPKWKKVLKMAQKQNKPIFVDAYTTWCGPCKIMDRDVFTKKEITGFFNENFINVKLDMEKGEGIQLKTDWEVQAFPTFLYFNPNGEIIHRIVGAYNAGEFLNYSSATLDEGKTAKSLQEKYDSGERGGSFMFDYLVSLRLGYYKELEEKVANNYLSSLSNKDLLKEENWNVIKYFMKDPTSKEFQYLVTKREKLGEVVDQTEVKQKLLKTIDDQIKVWSYWYGDKPFETEKESTLIKFLQTTSYDKAPYLLGELLANKYKRTENKGKYLETIDNLVAFNLVDKSSTIVSYANSIIGAYENESALAKALNWLKVADAKETKIEHKAAILNAMSKVLDKLGNKSEAELTTLAAKKADKEAEEAGTKIHTIPAMKMTGMKPKKSN